MKRPLLSLLLLVTTVCLKAQSNSPSTTFYKHYIGSINQSISIVFNLYRTGDELEGSYYYPSEGKTLNLYGRMVNDSSFAIDEIARNGQEMCSFLGNFEKNNTLIEGFWKDTTGILKRDFFAKESYDSGTVHFDIRQIKMAEGADSQVAAYEVIQPIAKDMKNAKAENAINLAIENILVNLESDILIQKPGFNGELHTDRDLEKYGKDFIAFELKDMKASAKPKGPRLLDNIGYIDYNANNIIGLQFASVLSSGGDSPSVGYNFHNFDSRSGKELKLSDILKKGYQPALQAELIEVLEHIYYPKGKAKQDIQQAASIMLNESNFYLTEKGIGFFRNAIPLISEGIIDVFIPYSHLSKWIKPNGAIGWALK